MNLGIPYMGSKRKFASDILRFIKLRHYDLTHLYDLFGGGGAISFTCIKEYPKVTVHYNELNSHIFYLVEYLKTHKLLEPKFFEWVTRDVFFQQCTRMDADWYSGFVMSCWSFGNKQSSYIYGSDIEDTKRLAHEFIVNGCLSSMDKLNVNLPHLLDIKDIQQRRILFCDYISKTNKSRFDIQNLERMVQLERINHLQNLQNLQNLQITNLSYENVIITGDNPIIYADIPYKGTTRYKEGGFDYDRFYQWANDINYPVYISEYNAPFKEVFAFKHISSLSATNNSKKTIEKIFWNEKGNANKTSFLS